MPEAVFVVRLPAGARAARASAADVGPLRPLPGAPEGTLLVGAPDDARATWARLVAALGGGVFVAPVLRGPDGERYPTGRVTVRFRDPPDDAALAAFAERHGLVLAARNAFQPRQACFDLAQPGTSFLPEVLRALEQAPGVARAWPETLAAYRRR